MDANNSEDTGSNSLVRYLHSNYAVCDACHG